MKLKISKYIKLICRHPLLSRDYAIYKGRYLIPVADTCSGTFFFNSHNANPWFILQQYWACFRHSFSERVYNLELSVVEQVHYTSAMMTSKLVPAQWSTVSEPFHLSSFIHKATRGVGFLGTFLIVPHTGIVRTILSWSHHVEIRTPISW